MKIGNIIQSLSVIICKICRGKLYIHELQCYCYLNLFYFIKCFIICFFFSMYTFLSSNIQDSHFIYSFSPVPGINRLFIRLAEAPTAKVMRFHKNTGDMSVSRFTFVVSCLREKSFAILELQIDYVPC